MTTRKKTIISVAVFILLFITGAFTFRDQLLQWKVNRICKLFNKKYHGELIISKTVFNGFKKVNLTGIKIISPESDTVLKISEINTELSLRKILIGKIIWKELFINDVSLNLKRENGKSNYDFLFHSQKDSANENKYSIGYGERLNGLLKTAFELSGGNIISKNINITWKSQDYKKFIHVPIFELINGVISMQLNDQSKLSISKWIVGGLITADSSYAELKIYHDGKEKQLIPFLDKNNSLQSSVDTIYLKFMKEDLEDEVLTLNLNTNYSNLAINHWRVAPDDIIFNNLNYNLKLSVGKNYISVDSTSTITINDLNINLTSKLEHDSSSRFSLNIDFDSPSQTFFESLPQAIFNTFKGIKTSGNLSYALNFFIDTNEPDSLIFNSSLKKSNFRIIHYGQEYFPKIDTTFKFDAYDKDLYVRSFMVGHENPDFTPLGQISSYLKNSVLMSEDGAFYNHRGFNEEAFREAIATNIEEKRFVRGGSTITMQLVKNVFLSRDKTVSRKLQEALIVWLIENNNLVSKDRMLEVYLNIIEWGPNIYGIKEASQFYFKKNPNELTLAESIYLASIIPHPKYFKYSFDEKGNLKPFLNGFYRIIAEHLLRKNLINPNDTVNLRPEVTLKGAALNFILPHDSVPLDSLQIEDDRDF